ncbi:uncharacterized protein [Penaeus vannamei]|uniref:uncharacterized protein n=1 Tax=Penaeus vannamei TaxID=6689 RepID=UPI00387F89CF
MFTTVLGYLFILTIRRLSGKPITTYFKSKYGKTALDTFRRTEKLSYRSKKPQKDIKFLNLGKYYDVIPKFLNFRVHNPVFESTQIYRSWCFVLLDREISNQKKKETVITDKLNKDYLNPKSILSPMDYICITRLINNNVHKKMVKVDNIHSNKLLKLGIDVMKKVDKNKVIFNFSDKNLSEEQKDILSHGLDYCLPPTKKTTTKISTHLLYLEDKLKRLLRAIKPSIGESTYNFLSTSGSQPGMLYGLPKVHKPNIPLRPIISSIGTFNYNTAKFLVPIISPLTTNQYTIENSTAFASEITSLDLEQPNTMASFDVESLFTNVPLLETTEIIVDNIQTTHLNKFGLTKDSFKKLLNITAHHSVFSYNDDLYTQTDGVAMGSPLGPSYTNAFLCHHEINWLKQCPPEFRPVYYRRYIDDTFVLFKHPSHVNLFLNYLNSKHQSIKFTCETQLNNQLPFLDTYVTIDNGRFHTSIYRKPTFTGLGLHFLSNIPYIYKINSIRTLITIICAIGWSECITLHQLRGLQNDAPSPGSVSVKVKRL